MRALKIVIFTLLILPFMFLLKQPVKAAGNNNSTNQFVKGIVIGITKQGTVKINGANNLYQMVKIKLVQGNYNGKIVTIENGGQVQISRNELFKTGDQVVIQITTNPDKTVSYYIYDRYRLNAILYILLIFIVLVVIIANLKGIGAIAGMTVSISVILLYIVPQILAGKNPLFIAITGSFVILIVATYLAHGISWQTTSALVSTFVALIITVLLSILFVHIAQIEGLGSEQTSLLQIGQTSTINLQGLFLGGVIIGTLGALNDITTTQSSAIFELSKANANTSLGKLISTGFVVGKEHIVSLVNTLVLAYAGSSIPIFIFFILNPSHQPIWVIINNETAADEIIRTLAGSIGLIMVVPIVTIIASVIALQRRHAR